MANDIVTMDHIAASAIETLYETCVMAQLVHRDYEQEFLPGRGRTISIRRPTIFESKPFNRAEGIVVQDIDEGLDDVTMDKIDDVSFSLTSEEWTLDVTEFDRRFTMPACEAIAQGIDKNLIAAANTGFTQAIGNVTPNAAGEDYAGYGGHYPWSDSRVMIEASKVLNTRAVPLTERRLVAGPATAAMWEAEKAWRHADKSGAGTEGLREGSFGARKHGFDPYMTQHIAEPTGTPAVGLPNSEVSLAFHKTAIALVTRPLVVPAGAASARIAEYGGFGVRIVQGYDQAKKQDTLSFDVLYGIKVLNPERGLKIRSLRAA